MELTIAPYNRCLVRAVMLVICILGLQHSFVAEANVNSMFGFGSRNGAMGMAGTAFADDLSSLFYNPGNMLLKKENQLGVNMLLAHMNFNVKGLENNTVEVPPLDDVSGFAVGGVIPLAGFFQRRVAFGVAVQLPLDKIIRIDSYGANEPNFYRYQDLPHSLAVYLAGCYELFSQLSIGGGVKILAVLDGNADFEVSTVNPNTDQAELYVTQRHLFLNLGYRAAPILGLNFTPIKNWHTGLAYQGKLDLPFTLPVVATIPFNTGETDASGKPTYVTMDLQLWIFGDSVYTPHQISWGMSYTFGKNLLIGADATWYMWSRSPHPGIEFGVNMKVDEAPNSEIVLIDELNGITPGHFRDVITPQVGLEYLLGQNYALRAGYSFNKSFIPNQTHPDTNMIDNDKHIIAAGAGVKVDTLPGLEGVPFHFDIYGQYHALVARDTIKEKTDDPVGSYRASGSIWVFGFGVNTHF